MRKQGGYENSARLYDLFDDKENLELFCNRAASSGEVIDVGAGTGRIAIPLARRGVRVYCVEPSPAMRRVFDQKLDREPQLRKRITLVPSYASSFEAGRRYPAAYLSGSFDHLLDDSERMAALSNVNRHLTTGGMLVFDVFLGSMGDKPLSPAGVAQTPEGEVRRFVGGRVLPGGRKETTLVFERYVKGELVERIEEHSLVGITSRPMIHDLLSRTGFELAHEWGDYDQEPYIDGDDMMIVEASKAHDIGE
ncbi:methyltransferase domain-containing protein [Candidatus Fermentibacteria bacterium]|nr:methyltransferase domain-containing protein [Candidatus Fermentibacteria bacterium]